VSSNPDQKLKIKIRGDIEQVRRVARLCIAPPKAIPNHREVASKIKFPDGPMAGQTYDPELDPVHAAVTQELDADWVRYILVGAVQTGKSLLLMVATLRALCCARQSVVYSQPTGPKIDEAWTGKMLPVIESSEYKPWMPSKGQGSKGSQSLSFILLRDPATGVRAGMLYGIPGGGKSEAAQAAVTAPVIINDEVDSYRDRHRVELVAKRADSFGRKAKRFYTSTVKSDSGSIILGMYADSTKSRLWFKCPDCGHWQPLEWANVLYDGADEVTAMSTVKYRCGKCDVLWNDDRRALALQDWRLVHDGQAVNEDGVVIGDKPRTMTFGLLWTALDSSLRSLATLASEHFRAMRALDAGEHGPMRSFYRDQLCCEYTGEIEEMETAGLITWQFLQRRTNKEKWGPTRAISDRDPAQPDQFLYSRHVAPVPQEAERSVLAVDVQHNRVYWILRAFDRLNTSWLVGWGYEYARLDHEPADKQETRAMLNRVWAAVKQYCGTADIVCAGLDVADNTEDLRGWVNDVGSPWRAMTGMTRHMKAEDTDMEGLAYWRDGLILHHSDAGRDMFHQTLRRPVDAVGATHFPYGIGTQDIAIFRHLVSEQTGIDPDTKKRIIVRGAGRNDWLDCAKMTEVLIQGYLMEKKRVESIAPPAHRNGPVNDLPNAGTANTPVRVGSPLQTNRRESKPEGSLYRVQRRHGIFRREF